MKSKKYIAITFDDGPSKKYTNKVLKILAKYDAKATFFIVGSEIAGREKIVKKIFDAGHEIGNHGFVHDAEKINNTSIKKSQKIIYDICGKYPTLFRFPGGLINSGINPLLAKHNLVAVDWSVDSLDWKLKDKDKITDRVLSKVEDGDVVLLHDIHLETIEALEQILSNLKAQGYEFVTVSELFAIYNVTPTFGKLYFHDVESKNNIYSYINSQKANKDDYELILLMGCDVSSDINYYTTKPTEQQKCMRSDTMVIACINKKTKRVKLISLLRDIYVDIPGFGKDKLNAAIVYGGPMLALQTINKNFNLDIKKYIVINMESFVKTVDRLGGIDVELTKQEAIYINAMVEEAKALSQADYPTKFIKKRGLNHLDGTQALAHIRNRVLGLVWKRSSRQRELLILLFKKAKEEMNVFEFISFGLSMLKYVKTNFTIFDVVKYGLLGFKCDPKNIETLCVPIHGLYKAVNGKVWYFDIDFIETNKQIEEFIYN